ncbi:MAG: DUF4965 domain-containing protein [Clostridia bacterium]|nr:DUF4965 domain-containing protein [Clostridia bacterium]
MTMKLRPPAIPLINIDPYFSVWSTTNVLTDSETSHWTSKPNTIKGTVTIDGEAFRFMGLGEEAALAQTAFDFDAFSTYYTFENEKVVIKATFTSPLIPTDVALFTRPVTYLALSAKSKDGKNHKVTASVAVSEELCLDVKGQSPVEVQTFECPAAIRMGNKEQKVLNRSGDDVRIDWGYVYLANRDKNAAYSECNIDDMHYINAEAEIGENGTLFMFAYDDIYSLEYFEKHLKCYWNKDGKTILEAISEASADYEATLERCNAFSDKLFIDATKAGGEKYAEMLLLATRQAMNAHKVAIDENGEILFISKECFSNGCGTTVDVSYPSIPMFLLYNPELVKGMMRPIYKFVNQPEWTYDFAPHDCGQFPILNRQVYGYDKETKEHKFDMQMPVEECGNMLVMEATVALAEGNADFAKSHLDILDGWVKYLEKYGIDPENQLCTDDFAGHLAHNCNLTLKAIMGIVSYAIILDMLGDKEGFDKYIAEAKEMADSWIERAKNPDGSFRLAFDRPNTFSMKYNCVWDKLFETGIFDRTFMRAEVNSNFEHFGAFGMPLDNRSTYTKSDWLVWTATLCSTKDEFERYVLPLWNAYNYSASRVPMTDWYFTDTGLKRGFQNRTVIAGLFIKLLEASGKMVYNRK